MCMLMLSMEWPMRLTSGSPHILAYILHVCLYAWYVHIYIQTHSSKTMQLRTQHWIWKWFRIRKEVIRVFQTWAFTPFLLIALLTTPRHDLTEMLLDSNQTTPLAWYDTVQVPSRVQLILGSVHAKLHYGWKVQIHMLKSYPCLHSQNTVWFGDKLLKGVIDVTVRFFQASWLCPEACLLLQSNLS